MNWSGGLRGWNGCVLTTHVTSCAGNDLQLSQKKPFFYNFESEGVRGMTCNFPKKAIFYNFESEGVREMICNFPKKAIFL
jgi:hypothetical protein